MTTYHTIPDLDARMKAVGATNAELAAKSGLGYSTISMLRAGKTKARAFTRDLILQALETKKFKGAYVRQK